MASQRIFRQSINIGPSALCWEHDAAYLKWQVEYTVHLSDVIRALCQLQPSAASDLGREQSFAAPGEDLRPQAVRQVQTRAPPEPQDLAHKRPGWP
eukprot:349634-Amphidinium_carterae.1